MSIAPKIIRERLSKQFPGYDFSMYEYHGSKSPHKGTFLNAQGQQCEATYKTLQENYRKKLAAETPATEKPVKPAARFTIHTTPEKKKLIQEFCDYVNMDISELFHNSIFQSMQKTLEVQRKFSPNYESILDDLEEEMVNLFFGPGK